MNERPPSLPEAKFEELTQITEEQRIAPSRPKSRRPFTKSPLDRIALRIFHKQLHYDQHWDEFEECWFALSDPLRRAIDKAAKRFPNCAALRRAHLDSQAPGTTLSSLQAQWYVLQSPLPQVDQARFIALLRAPTKDRSQFAEAFGKRTTAVLKEYLGVKPHRPRQHLDRDWMLTKWAREDGLSQKKARAKWDEQNPESKPLTPEAVKQAISRMQEKVGSDLWDRRLYVYLTNFPRIKELTCKECKGDGARCRACNGTGRIPPSTS